MQININWNYLQKIIKSGRVTALDKGRGGEILKFIKIELAS